MVSYTAGLSMTRCVWTEPSGAWQMDVDSFLPKDPGCNGWKPARNLHFSRLTMFGQLHDQVRRFVSTSHCSTGDKTEKRSRGSFSVTPRVAEAPASSNSWQLHSKWQSSFSDRAMVMCAGIPITSPLLQTIARGNNFFTLIRV